MQIHSLLLFLILTTGSDTGLHRSKHVRCIMQDHTGTFWFATDGDGVCRYDGTSSTHFRQKDGLCSDFVWSILEDQAGNLWFRTGDGISRYDRHLNTFTTLADIDTVRSNGSGRSLERKPLVWHG